MSIFYRKLDENQYFVRKTFRRFFWPAVFSSVWLAIAGVVDSVFVGHAIGAAGLSAISLGMPVYLFYNILSYGFSIGGSIHFAARLAEGREREGNRIFITVTCFLMTVYIATALLGILFLPQLMVVLGADPADTLTASYIRMQLLCVPILYLQGPMYFFVNADNDPKTAAFAMSLSGMLDALFSYVFIISMGMGVIGSVCSTLVGAAVMLSITGSHFLAGRGVLRFRPEKMDWSCLPAAARTGFSTALQYLYQFVTMIAVNHLLMHLGGVTAVAAFDVVYNISLLCASIPEGTAVATEPMLASYRSERNLGNIRITQRLALQWSCVLACIGMLVFLSGSGELSRIFGMDSGMAFRYTSNGIRIYALSVLPAMLNMLFCGYYQSIQREWLAYLITVLRNFLFYLIAMAFCVQGGLEGFWYVFVLTECMTLLVWIPLAVRRGGFLQLRDIDVSRAKSVAIDSTSRDISEMTQILQRFCKAKGGSEKEAMYIGLTVEEICLAVTEHFAGLFGDIRIQITLVMDSAETTLYIRDNALEFNPMAENTDRISLEEGRHLDLVGLRIVQKNAKEFYYRRYSGFNTLVIRL